MPDGSPFLVLEYLAGESLHERIVRGPVAGALLQSILQQVASGLDAAHSKGVIHRDLKPRNIFLIAGRTELPEGIFVKVIDFGISKLLGADTLESTTSRALGTPRYMSPEQVRGEDELIGPQTDQFALAAITYELVAGKPAFGGDNLDAVLYRIAHENPTPLCNVAPHASAQLERAVTRALSKAPAARFGSATEFVQAAFADTINLDTCGPTIPMQSQRTVSTTVRRRKKRLGKIIVLAAVAATTVAGATVAVYWRDQPTRALPATAASSVAAVPILPRSVYPHTY